MTDLLVIRSSFSDPSLHKFGAFSPAPHDDDVGRTPPRGETKPKENRPSDPVSRAMKAVLSCSPGNPKYQRKMKIRAFGRGTQVQHALAEEEILASKCSSKPGSPVGKQAAVSPRRSPRGRRTIRIRWQQGKVVQRGSNTQEAEDAYGEEDSILLGDKRQSKDVDPLCAFDDGPGNHTHNCYGKQADVATVAASARMSPKMRRSKQWQQHKDAPGGSNTQEATEAYEEEDSILMSPNMSRSKQWQHHKDVHVGSKQEATEAYEEEASILLKDRRQSTDIDQSCAGGDDEPGNKTDNCLSVNLVMDQSSLPGDVSEEEGRWTGDKRAKVIASPPTPQVAHYKLIDNPCDKEEFWDVYEDPEQLNEVQERLALYRIKAHKLFWEGKELDIAQLKEEYSSDTLRDAGYFQKYEMNCEWYFNPEYCERSALEDYQRLVLHNDVTYISWESCHTTCTTLKCDQEFLQFYEELLSKLKLIEDDDVEPDQEHFDAQRRRYEIKAHIEAPKIAARFSSIYADLVQMGITDATWSAMFDLTYHKDLDHVFFEIWKRVAKDKVSFAKALLDVYELNLYPFQHRFIKAEFEERPLRSIKMKEAYYSHVAHIDEKVPEDEVAVLIKEAVNKILPKPFIYADYIRKKMEVAEEIGVISLSLHQTPH